MKIKTKKEMNLPQLIEWGFENDVTNTWYRASNVEEYISEVYFGATGLPQFANTVDKQDTFTVEIEEEITEDTVIPLKILEISKFDDLSNDEFYLSNRSINSFKDERTLEIYVEHKKSDKWVLIWTKEKGLL